MKLPGPDHPMTIAPAQGRVQVRFGDVVVADSQSAMELKEATYPAVLYIPRTDARMEYFHCTDHGTQCPYKGAASYFSLRAGGRTAENAVWTYETPYPAAEAIKDHLAFYPNQVTLIRDDD